MLGILGSAPVDHYNDGDKDYALEWCVLCAEPNDEADCGLHHFTGTLEQVSGSPYSLSSAPNCIAVAPGGGFLYVGTVSGIYLYSIGSGGALTIGNGGAVISSDIASAMQVSGSWLIDAFLPAAGTVQMNAIPINSSTGAYTGTGAPPFQPFNVGNARFADGPVSGRDQSVFALGTGGTIVVPFTAVNANPLGSKATVIPTVNSSGSALSVAVDPTNRLFYIGETLATRTSGGLRVFNYSSLSGALLRLRFSDRERRTVAERHFAHRVGRIRLRRQRPGQYRFGEHRMVSHHSLRNHVYDRCRQPYCFGDCPIGLAEDSDDDFVLAVSTGGSTASGDPDLEAFTMSSGALTAPIATVTGTDPVGADAVAALP